MKNFELIQERLRDKISSYGIIPIRTVNKRNDIFNYIKPRSIIDAGILRGITHLIKGKCSCIKETDVKIIRRIADNSRNQISDKLMIKGLFLET